MNTRSQNNLHNPFKHTETSQFEVDNQIKDKAQFSNSENSALFELDSAIESVQDIIHPNGTAHFKNLEKAIAEEKKSFIGGSDYEDQIYKMRVEEDEDELLRASPTNNFQQSVLEAPQ